MNRPETRVGRIFAISIQALILLSLVAFSLETLPALPQALRRYLGYFEVFTISVFTVEYILRIIAAERPWRFVFSFFGLVDLFAILPFYLTTSLDLRAIRGFRFLRLFRIFKLARYSEAVQRYHRAFTLSREELGLFGVTSLVVVFLSATGIYYFENPGQPEVFSSVFHSLWWAVITLTTVGYGDMVPLTAGGRILTFVILIAGIGVITVPTAILSGALSRAHAEDEARERAAAGALNSSERK